MAPTADFTLIDLSELYANVDALKEDSWRYVQTLAVTVDDGVDLVYTFMKQDKIKNLKINGVKDTDIVPSITDLYLAAFVFENEIHDLFAIDIRDIAIDFKGNFYRLSVEAPMRVISAEKLAQKEKEAKLTAAKAAKEKAAKESASADAELEAKLAAMDPEKAAKVRAAMAAKAAKEKKEQPAATPGVDAELEAKLAAMDPEKAAKVRAAMAAKAAKAQAENTVKEGE